MRKRLWGLLKRGGSFLVGGIVDSIVSRDTHHKINFGQAVASKLNECEPWNDHYEHSIFVKIDRACKDKDFSTIRAMLAIGAKEGASQHCLELAEFAINMLALGIEPEFSLFFSMME